MKFVLKGLAYAGLIIMIIIMMMIASSCSAEPKPEMSHDQAFNLTDSIRKENAGKMMLDAAFDLDMNVVNRFENATALDNYMSDKVGNYVTIRNLSSVYLIDGITGYGYTLTYYSDGSMMGFETDIKFEDLANNGYDGLYGYLAKATDAVSTYYLVGTFPVMADGTIDVNYFTAETTAANTADSVANSSDSVEEETTATVDPELTDPSTRPSDLSKCFTIDMFAQAERTTMNLLEEHVGQWVHLTNLYASMNDGSAYMYAYVGSENWDMDGEGTLQVAGEGGYLNIALADGMTNEFYGFVGIDGMTREVYIGNIFAANEDTLCSDPTGPNGEPPSDWGGSEPSSTIYVDEDISVNEVRFAAQHAGERIIYEGTVNSIYENYVLLDWEYYVYFSDPTQIWNFNEDDIIRIEGGICVDGFGLVNFSDATLIAVIN